MVIDTMVFAYAMLGVPEFREESLALLEAATEIHVPDSFRAELVNVVWQWVQYKGLSLVHRTIRKGSKYATVCT